MSTISPATRRWPAALTGLLYVLCFLVSQILPGLLGQTGGAPPITPYSSDADVANYLAVTPRGLVLVAAFCQAMSALALLLFVPHATNYVRGLAREGAAAGYVRISGTVAATFLLLSASIQWVFNQPGMGDDLHVYRAVQDLVFITGAGPQVATTGVLIGAISLVARKARALPAWLNWLGLTVAALSVLSMLSLLAFWASAFIPLGRYLGMVWFLGLGLTLLLRRARSTVKVAPGTVSAATE